METRYCLGCKQAFHPHPRCPKQKYCSKKACQQMRKRRWQRHKLKTDADYRENQKAAQQHWRDAHPFHHRVYLLKNPDYVARNREEQRQRDQASRLAKMDVLMVNISVVSTAYSHAP